MSHKHNEIENECCCSHNHEHEHEHHHEHHHEQDEQAVAVSTKHPLHIYTLENLGCANCAAKMEQKIRVLPGVEFASITFATKQLRVSAKNPEKLLPLMQEACSAIESDVKIVPLQKGHKDHSASESNESKKDLLCILCGAVLLVIGVLVENTFPLLSLLLLVVAYLVLGLEIVLTAVKNLFKGNFFDENFLMSIATIGAFVIKDYPEAVGVMLFYRIGEWFEHKAVQKSRSQIMEALDLRPETVNVVQGNDVTTLPAEDACVGDILLVRPGDRIPLDGVVVDGESLLDTSPVTGEPVPVSISPRTSVLSGCLNTTGVIKMRVEKLLSESMVSRILDSVENAAASKPHIDRFITRFSRIYTPFVVILALCTAIIPSLITGDWNKWVYTALSFLVISCPCALVLSVPLAYFSGIGAGSKQGILFKGGASLEAMKNVKAIVMDKTGTITKGNFVVQKVVPFDASSISEDDLLALAASCETASTHPIGQSICEAAKEKGLALMQADSIMEISGHGIEMQTANDVILCGNRKLMESRNVNIAAYASVDYGTEALIAKNGILLGYLVIADTLKEDAPSAIASLKGQGFTTAMLTGDAEENAQAIASKIGIDEVYARLLPEEKVEKLSLIRKKHGAVMFVGDGINDAPVLAGADVGAAMGSGADAAIEAADVVFMRSAMQAIPTALKIAKATGKIATQNVAFALAIKALVMVLGLMGIASMWLAVFADTGVAMLCILNSIRLLYKK